MDDVWSPLCYWGREDIESFMKKAGIYNDRYRYAGIADWKGKIIKTWEKEID